MKHVSACAFALLLAVGAGPAAAQGNAPAGVQPPPPADSGHGEGTPGQHHMGIYPQGGMYPNGHAPNSGGMTAMAPDAGPRPGTPSEAGQAAFGAIQEIVRILLADPTTNWSKVDIDALRQHLIDMDEVTLHADARKEAIENGLRIVVSGSGRTLAAIQRMVPAHARDIDGIFGWSVRARALPNGEEMTVTGNGAADAQKIAALGFMGIMVLGTHQMHHLAMAKGEMMPMR
jgi:hypothetical protein